MKRKKKEEALIIPLEDVERFRRAQRLKSRRDAEIVLRTMHAPKKVDVK